MNKVQMKEDRICDDMSIVYFVESKNDKVRVLGNLEGFEMINRVYDGGGNCSNYWEFPRKQL